MANLLWDLPLTYWECACCNIQPFLGAGVGYDQQRMRSSNSRIIFNQKWNQFAWQVMAGVAYPIFCNTEVSLEYKFHRSSSHFYSQSVDVGLTYNW
jgi:outer membrane autotransporter protein